MENLDREMAELIGWFLQDNMVRVDSGRNCSGYFTKNGLVCYEEDWHPSTDIAQALQVAEKMFEFPEDIFDRFLKRLVKNCPQIEPWRVMGWWLAISNKPEAICLAAREAMKEGK